MLLTTLGATILSRALLRVTDVDSLFVSRAALLQWTLRQWGRESAIVRSWVSI